MNSKSLAALMAVYAVTSKMKWPQDREQPEPESAPAQLRDVRPHLAGTYHRDESLSDPVLRRE